MDNIMRIIPAFVLIFSLFFNIYAFSDGFEESLIMPSVDAALRIKPESEETLEDGSIKQSYENITEEQFNVFLFYADQDGCSLANYSVKGSLFSGSFLKDSKTFSLSYDISAGSVAAIYPVGTEAEKGVYHKVGEHVFFGHYEQDNDSSNGTEEIEWTVLDIDKDSMLLVSYYGLDCKSYSETPNDTCWEDSSVRSWLNNKFVNDAFTLEERSKINEIKVLNIENSKYQTDAGNDTTDKLFLLSSDEVNNYFPDDADRKCSPTVYCKIHGGWTSKSFAINGKGTGLWWLRSPGKYKSYAAYISYFGVPISSGSSSTNCHIMIRPAMWVDARI